MKKIFFFTIISFNLIILLSQSDVIRITNGEWEPYLSEFSPHYGLYSHIVSEAFKQEGISVKWGFFPWKRSYQLAKSGKYWDASAVWWPREGTKKDFYISEPVGKTSFVFFHLKSLKFDWNTIEDLNSYLIGITAEYDYGSEFMNAIKAGKITVDIVYQDEVNLRNLLNGRIDLFPNDKIVGYAQIHNNFSPEEIKLFTHHPREFEISTLCLIISKRCKNGEYFLEKFNSGLNKLRKNGKLEQLYQDARSGKYKKQIKK